MTLNFASLGTVFVELGKPALFDAQEDLTSLPDGRFTVGSHKEIHPRRYVLLTPSWGFDGPTVRRVRKVSAESSDARWTRYLYLAPPPLRPWLVFRVSGFDGLLASGDLLALARAWDRPFRR